MADINTENPNISSSQIPPVAAAISSNTANTQSLYIPKSKPQAMQSSNSNAAVTNTSRQQSVQRQHSQQPESKQKKRNGVLISNRNGRAGIMVPKAWSYVKDQDNDQIYWLMTGDCRGTVMEDYYDRGSIDFTEDFPFGEPKQLQNMLRLIITAPDENGVIPHSGVIFVGAGRTRANDVQYAANIFRTASPQSADLRMYVANMLLAYPDAMEVGSITAAVIATTEAAKQREQDIMSQFKDSETIRLNEKTIYRQADPYDRTFDKGEPMYAFERIEYDKQYPEHPLTQLRKLVAHIIYNN